MNTESRNPPLLRVYCPRSRYFGQFYVFIHERPKMTFLLANVFTKSVMLAGTCVYKSAGRKVKIESMLSI